MLLTFGNSDGVSVLMDRERRPIRFRMICLTLGCRMVDRVDDPSDEPRTQYYVHVWGSSLFHPRDIAWPDEIVVYTMRTPGEEYTARKKREIAECGFAALKHRDSVSEIDMFTSRDPIIEFLIRNRESLSSAGVEETVVMLGIFREGVDPQMNTEFTIEQLENLSKA